MSDFVSDFWNLYVVVIVTGSILACVALLIIQGKATFTPGKTMGHVWDETLEEYNNPMPRWWTWMFVITVIFAFVYLALYPGLGNFKGMLGWTAVGQHKAEVAKVDAGGQSRCSTNTWRWMSRRWLQISRRWKWASVFS